MFSVHCPRHGAEILLSNRHIESIGNTTSGIEVRWRCICGHQGTFLTGVHARRRPGIVA